MDSGDASPEWDDSVPLVVPTEPTRTTRWFLRVTIKGFLHAGFDRTGRGDLIKSGDFMMGIAVVAYLGLASEALGGHASRTRALPTR